MKKCPACGYVSGLSNLQRIRKYNRVFGKDLPVREMIARGWLGQVDEDDIDAIKQALCKFFDVSTFEEVGYLLDDPGQFIKRFAIAQK